MAIELARQDSFCQEPHVEFSDSSLLARQAEGERQSKHTCSMISDIVKNATMLLNVVERKLMTWTSE